MRHLIILTILTLTLTACAGALRQEAPDRRHFALETLRTEQPLSMPVFDGKLVVNRLGVAPAFSSRNLLYRMTATEYESDYYNLFLINPGELITQEIRKWLTWANLFEAVIPPGSMFEAAYTLEGHVLELYGDFSEGSGVAVLTIQLFMVHEPHGETEIMHQGRYERRVPLLERSPAGLVRGYNQALASILQQMEKNLLERSLLTIRR
jgi:cholesterol transport system auxiliary component